MADYESERSRRIAAEQGQAAAQRRAETAEQGQDSAERGQFSTAHRLLRLFLASLTKFASASLRSIQANVTPDIPVPTVDHLGSVGRGPVPVDRIRGRIDDFQSKDPSGFGALDAGTMDDLVAELESARRDGRALLEVADVQPVGRAILWMVTRAAIPDEPGVLWFDNGGNRPPINGADRNEERGATPSFVDALIILNPESPRTVDEIDNEYAPTMDDVHCPSLVVEFKTNLASDPLLYRAVAQDLGWMFFCDGTYHNVLEQGKTAFGLVSDGLTWRCVMVRRKPGLRPADYPSLRDATEFRKLYEFGVTEAVTIRAADLHGDGPPSEAIRTLCKWVAQFRDSMRGAADPLALSFDWDRTFPNTVTSDDGEETVVDVGVRTLAISERMVVHPGVCGGQPITATRMRKADCAKVAAMLLRVEEAGGSPHVPRVIAHGLIKEEWNRIRLMGLDHLLATNAIGKVLPELQLSLSLEVTGLLLHDVGEALLALERAGIVHRDVKPDNIIWSRKFGAPQATDEGYTGGMFLIDYDLSVVAAEFQAGDEVDPAHFAGTPVYASTPALCGFAPAFTDDWESLLYTALVEVDHPQGQAFCAWLEERFEGLTSDDMDELRAALVDRLAFARAALDAENAFVQVHRAHFEEALERAGQVLAQFDDTVAPQLARAKFADNALNSRLAEEVALLRRSRKEDKGDGPHQG